MSGRVGASSLPSPTAPTHRLESSSPRTTPHVTPNVMLPRLFVASYPLWPDNLKVSSLWFCARLRLRPLLLRAGSLIALAALSGCDVPTELPIIEQRWVIPIEDKSISVTELLPPSGDVTISGGNFQVNVTPYTVTQTLGDFCPLCAVIDGFTVPKPPFNFTYNDSGGLPTDVVSVEVVSGSIFLGIQNDLGFDPIRPAVADPGTLTVTLYDGDIAGRVLGQAVLAGATDSLPGRYGARTEGEEGLGTTAAGCKRSRS